MATRSGYTSFVAPALLATSAMNGAIFDSTFNIFFRLKYAKLYDAALATPMRSGDVALGEIGWALIRGGLYACAFMVIMLALGLVHSVWAVLAIPVALLVGFAFAGAGMAATTFIRSWQDFEYVTLATLPMFLFSTTFYPLSVYPRPIQLIVDCTPLYQGIALLRSLTLGYVSPGLLWHVLYLTVMGAGGLAIAGRRIGRPAAAITTPHAERPPRAPIKITRGSRRQPAVLAARAVEARRSRARVSSARCARSGRRRHHRRCRDDGGAGRRP